MRVCSRFGAAMVLCGLAAATGAAVAKEPALAGDCWLAGFKAGDADAVSACYAEDAVMWLPGGAMAKGRSAIRDAYAGFLGGVTIKDATLMPMGEQVMGDVRVSWGTYSVEIVDKASKAESVEHGRYTDVQKRIDGHWLYVVDHASDDPKPVAK